MTDQVEMISRARYRIVTAYALAFLLQQLGSLEFLQDLFGASEHWLTYAELFGAALMFLVLLFGCFAAIAYRKQSASIKKALKDDLVRDNMRRAITFAFLLVFLLSSLLFLIVPSVDISAKDMARIFLTTCLVVPYLRFAYLESRDA